MKRKGRPTFLTVAWALVKGILNALLIFVIVTVIIPIWVVIFQLTKFFYAIQGYENDPVRKRWIRKKSSRTSSK